ncbi:MAG: type II CRISPR-associated endonuclease Cas1 [Dinghuibacter sp.]|nr:type II CRISPR-associated endonuclease Cas1 [Dinghuibacter sp.]
MLKKLLSFSNPYHLSTRLGQLVIHNKATGEETTRPIADLGFVVFDNAQITFTQGVLQLMAEENVAVVICDGKHHPSSLMLHLDVHHIQAERFKHQVAASEPLRKQLWQQTVKAKIRNQAAVLALAGENNLALLNLANKVGSGDPANTEAQAARIYFKQLFGPGFLRNREGAPPNPSLNYGYAIIRAAVARALVGSGLLPTLGIHHRNKYNSFALADDIMEPFRPFADWLVVRQVREIPEYHFLNKDRKAEFLALLQTPCVYKKENSPLMVAMSYVSATLARCFSGEAKKLEYPELHPAGG